jgi:hypothetical protein
MFAKQGRAVDDFGDCTFVVACRYILGKRQIGGAVIILRRACGKSPIPVTLMGRVSPWNLLGSLENL